MIRFARLAGAGVVALGALVICGWAFDLGLLKSVVPGFVTMKANTALCFALAGASLWLHASRRRAGAARALGGAAALIGALTLAQYLIGADLGIDELLFRDDPAAVQTFSPGRMSPATAAAFALAGAALALLERRIAEGLALAALFIGFVALAGYAYYGSRPLYGIGPYTTMAVHTAAAFVLLSAGVVAARPERGVPALLTAPGSAGALARRLLPFVVVIPLLLNWATLAGERAGMYGAQFAAAFRAAAVATLIAAIVLWASSAVARAERELRLHAEVVRHVPDGVAIWHLQRRWDPESLRLIAWNDAATRLSGTDCSALLGKTIFEVFPFLRDNPLPGQYVDVLRTGEPRRLVDYRGHVRDAIYALTLFPLPGDRVAALFEDVTERVRTDAEIRAARDRAEALTRELEAFAYSVSHDLRAPLRAMDGFSQALLEDCGDRLDEAGRDHARRVRVAAQRMGEMIDGLLGLSRVTRADLRREPVDLSALARAAAEDLRRAEPSRAVDVVIADGLRAEGDARLLGSLLQNLVGNAWKFTAAKPRARVEVGAKDGEFFVRDDGAGFDMAHAGKLFGAFQRLHGAAEFPGSGIGLATAARIVHRHGGQIRAEARPGEGATFFFTLPETGPQGRKEQA